MRFWDILLMSLSSLWKRRIRTILTVLGVVIGTASIVVMISLGLGLKRASLEEMEKYGSLKSIIVSEKDSYESDEEEGGRANKQTLVHLDDSVLESLRGIEHVEYVYPELEAEVMLLAGGYTCYTSVRGVPTKDMELIGLELAQGGLPEPGDTQLKFVYGNSVIGEFYNEKTGHGYWFDGTMAPVDLMNDPMICIFDAEKYYNFIWGNADESGNVAMPKKYMINAAGVMAGKVEDYNSNSNLIYCDLDLLKALLKKEFRGKAIPGQPTTISGKPTKEIYYTNLVVGVDDMKNVQNVQAQISQLGYSAESNAEWVESMQGQSNYIQLALGGIGAISLLVAAIGIANTMMMSIYERTKEIGIMKVLGCDMRNIQGMFLMEAGHIGLLGGLIGVALSYGLSFAINHFLGVSQMGIDLEGASSISYIPFWLSALSVAFSVAVGMAAGFFPSLRAMRLSPLAAIRNE
ncbi:MAG: ABC transporter permease [Lachnospiraceae bacterium]|nr:ABC transporter permease [Lachnospiraceae bacterium]